LPGSNAPVQLDAKALPPFSWVAQGPICIIEYTVIPKLIYMVSNIRASGYGRDSKYVCRAWDFEGVTRINSSVTDCICICAMQI
jgi:hypothetical protein